MRHANRACNAPLVAVVAFGLGFVAGIAYGIGNWLWWQGTQQAHSDA